MKTGISLMAALLVVVGVAAAQSQPPPPREAQPPKGEAKMTRANEGPDQAFAQKVLAGGLVEVALAEMAQKKASSPDVKKLADRIHTDHTKANGELKQMASKNGWTLKTAPGAEHSAMRGKLQKATGAEFDRAFVEAMIADHKKDIAEFERYSSSGTDEALKRFASSTLPTLKSHLDMAQECQRTMTTTR
jgi:putative membrane protein